VVVNNKALAARYLDTAKRQPKDKEIFLDEGSLWVYRGVAPMGVWELLGPPEEPGFQGSGALHFELQPGLMVVGTPSFVLHLVFRAFYRLTDAGAKDLTSMIYAMFKECGWRGPCESDNQAVPGTVSVNTEGASKIVHELDDVRPVYSQLQDPGFNGWLSLESVVPEPLRGNATDFINVARSLSIRIEQKAKDPGA